MPKLLILSQLAEDYQRLVAAANLPELREITTHPSPDCEIVFGEPARIRKVLTELPNLKWVQSVWAGVEPLLDPALRRDYILTNAREVFGGLMSEFVLGYLLLHERKILQRLETQKNHQWDQTTPGTLCGKTIAILGIGSIGAEVARTAKFFGMSVRGYTRKSEDCEHVDRYYHDMEPDGLTSARQQTAALHECCEGVDYLVSVLPNTSQTRQLINAELLARLPKHALFINVGRGSAVDQSALIQALETEAIAGAILDVFEQEPLPAEHPFWETKNLIVTSHTSAPSFPKDIINLFIENYRRYHPGEPLKHIVDFERGY